MQRESLTPSSVVAAAVTIADELGFDAVTLSAVARRLGVQPPSLYTHVQDLAGLRDGVIESALHDLSARISLAIAGRSGADALRAFADAHRRFAQETPGRWQALQRPAGPRAVGADAARTIVELTSAVLRGYALPDDEHVHAIRVLGATISGYLTLEHLGSFSHSDPDPEISWARALDALDALLRNWPPASDTKDPS